MEKYVLVGNHTALSFEFCPQEWSGVSGPRFVRRVVIVVLQCPFQAQPGYPGYFCQRQGVGQQLIQRSEWRHVRCRRLLLALKSRASKSCVVKFALNRAVRGSIDKVC